MLKLASQVRQTSTLTAGGTWGREYWWVIYATQRRAPTHCTATIMQNILFKSPAAIRLFIIFYPSMHSSQYHPASPHHYTHSQHVQGLSAYRPNHQPPDRKHILALLSSFTRQDADVRSEEIEQLCCFDRMKKLIGTKQNNEEQSRRDQISSIVIEQKINQMENTLGKQIATKPCSPKLHHRTASSNNFHRRSQAVESLKKDCLQKFIFHQVGKREKDVDDARKMIDRELKAQVDNLIEDKGLQLVKIKEDNEQLKKHILTLNLEIQSLKTREAKMKEYIEQLEELSKGKKETKKTTQSASENFQEKFRETFGDCTIEDLKRRLDVAIDRCLEGFQKVENRNQIVMEENRKSFNSKEERLQKRIQQLQNSENELLSNLRTLKLNKQLSQVQADELGRAKVDLGRLQKLILALYTQWHSDRGDGEKNLLKMVGCLNENYSYEEMVKYVVEYNRKFSTDQKLNDYLYKVLRGIQKLRRTIYPDQCNEKLDPLATLERIEKWIKLRVGVPTLVKRTNSTENTYLADP